MARRKIESSKGETRDKLNGLAKLAESFEGWSPAGKVLTRVVARPTCFVQIDRATKCGGWPLQRIAIVHGPSGMGKTAFVHGLGLSFLRANDIYAYVDAEMTTPEDWLVKLMAEHASSPGFVAMRPTSYESTVSAVRDLVEKLAAAKRNKVVAPGTSALIVVDSIRKLIPDRLMAKLAKSEGGIDGMGGRAAMYKAALNAQWLDELVPLLYHAGATMIFVARETENPDSSNSSFELDYKVSGGKALVFDASLACRVTRAAWIKRGSDENAEVIGEKHRVRIYKTKVGGKDGKHVDAHFYTSLGQLVPEGFDHSRALLELAIEFGLVERAKQKRSEGGKGGGGAWLDWASTGERFNGENQFVKGLADDPRLFAMLDGEVRARIDQEQGGGV